MRLTKLTPDGQGGYGLPRAGALQDKIIRKEADGSFTRLSDLTEAERRERGAAKEDVEAVDRRLFDPGAAHEELTAEACVVTYPNKTARPAAEIDELKAAIVEAALSQIDQEAENARLGFITAGAGQALVYQRKEAQARACLAAHDEQNPPAAGAYPALDAEVGITAADTLGVAAVVVGQSDAWAVIGDQIEATRLAAKKQASEATGDLPTVETAVQGILAGLTWPDPSA